MADDTILKLKEVIQGMVYTPKLQKMLIMDSHFRTLTQLHLHTL